MSNQESETTPTYEEAIAELESLVESLESGEIPLTRLVEKYERGTQLLELCRTKLGDAELRIQKIEKAEEAFALEDMDSEES